jgi:hypothetical protein
MAVRVKLNLAGREYLHFPVSGLPSPVTGHMEIRFPPSATWVEMDWVVETNDGSFSVWNGIGAPTHVRVLVAGPNVGSVGGVVLAAGSSTTPQLRLTSAPEVIIRTSPAVILVSSA